MTSEGKPNKRTEPSDGSRFTMDPQNFSIIDEHGRDLGPIVDPELERLKRETDELFRRRAEQKKQKPE